MAKQKDPFELSLTPDQRARLGIWLCDQVQDGLNARSTAEQDVDYAWQLYEQARTRSGKTAPWPNAADLTSYLASEKADSLHARLMKTVFGVDPVVLVEGWGAAQDKSPLVEEFHQWKAEEERLQSVLDRLFLQALVEPRGLLEIAEGTEMRTVRKRIVGRLAMHPETGGPLIDEDGWPVLERDDRGQIVEAAGDEGAFAAETVIDSTERVRTGPVYRILPYRDSLILPGHARDADEIWGYAKRFWRRMDVLRSRADAGVYDAEAVDKMSGTADRQTTPALERAAMNVDAGDDGQAEKELWELLILVDLGALLDTLGADGRIPRELRGERWYLCTIHPSTQGLLRVQHDDMERSRFVPVILFPRSDRVTEGYSFIGHKLITILEEHTAWRNMLADRAALQTQAPIKRLQGALWDPMEQPFGPSAVIDVRDPREVEPLVIPDVTAAAFQHVANAERTAERVAGINDVASGQVSQADRTLGEIQMATEQSFVRMDLIVKRAQEALEEIYSIRHAIWKRTLAERPDGEEAPASLVSNLEGRGVSIDSFLPERKITAMLLEGAFRFKPAGSVPDADPNMRLRRFSGMTQALGALQQIVPSIGLAFSTPQAQRALLRQFLQVFGIKQTQAFLGSPSEDLMGQAQLNLLPGAPAMPPPPMGMPGMGGPPPMGGPMGPPPMGPPPGGMMPPPPPDGGMA